MSGVKYSQIEIERERKARQDARQEIERLSGRFAATGSRIREIMAGMGEQLLSSFPEVQDMAASWEKIDLPEPAKGMDSGELQEVAGKISDHCEQAEDLLQKLVAIREHGRDAKAGELAARVEMLRNRLAGMAPLLDKWRPGAREDSGKQLDGCARGIDRDEFITVGESCDRLETGFDTMERDVSSLESRDRQRQVVLEALQEVCGEMGWEIDEPPHLENPDDPASSCLFTVDTFSAGRMSFRLSLDGIQVDSPFSGQGRQCYSQFDAFSERLKQHGVKTSFKKVDGDDDIPEDRTSDALDLDDVDTEGSMEA